MLFCADFRDRTPIGAWYFCMYLLIFTARKAVFLYCF